MSIRTALLTFTMLLALPACAFEGDDGASDGDGGDPNDAEQVQVAAGDGQGGEEPPGEPDLLLACDLPFPCEDPVELTRPTSAPGYTTGELCAFQALANARPGLIETVATFASAEAYLDHVPAGAGEVLRQAHGRSDGHGRWQTPVERCALKPAAFFTACAQGYDPVCLNPENWVEDCEILGSLTCPRS